jgi:hypothetical protein
MLAPSGVNGNEALRSLACSNDDDDDVVTAAFSEPLLLFVGVLVLVFALVKRVKSPGFFGPEASSSSPWLIGSSFFMLGFIN